jgi:hypothetical protein
MNIGGLDQGNRLAKTGPKPAGFGFSPTRYSRNRSKREPLLTLPHTSYDHVHVDSKLDVPESCIIFPTFHSKRIFIASRTMNPARTGITAEAVDKKSRFIGCCPSGRSEKAFCHSWDSQQLMVINILQTMRQFANS